MLGRLRMSTAEALDHYRTLTSKVFSKGNRKRNGTFKATTLKVAIKQVIKAALDGYKGGKYMIKGSGTNRLGKMWVSASCELYGKDVNFGCSVVCALPMFNTRFPRLFRSYSNPNELFNRRRLCHLASSKSYNGLTNSLQTSKNTNAGWNC